MSQQAAEQQQLQPLQDMPPTFPPKQQAQQQQRMRSPFLAAQHTDHDVFDSFAAELLEALRIDQAKQGQPPQHGPSTAKQECKLRQQQLHQQRQLQDFPGLMSLTMAPAAAAAAAGAANTAAQLAAGANLAAGAGQHAARAVAAGATAVDVGAQYSASRVAEVLEHWGSQTDADAAAVAQLLQDADCAHADDDHWQAGARQLLGSCADTDADAVAKLLQDADSTDDSDSDHHACVRQLLESCLQEAAERARSQTTQGSSSTVTTGLLLLGEDTGRFSSSSGSYPAAATDSGAVTIDWDAMLRAELIEASLTSTSVQPASQSTQRETESEFDSDSDGEVESAAFGQRREV